MTRARFRRNVSTSLAGLVAFLGAIPLVTSLINQVGPSRPSAYLLLLIFLIPLAAAVWAWRSGTDADTEGLRVRALIGSRAVPWSQVAALVPQGRRVVAALADGRALALPGVTRDDLPRLVAASGQPLDEQEAPDEQPALDEPAAQ